MSSSEFMHDAIEEKFKRRWAIAEGSFTTRSSLIEAMLEKRHPRGDPFAVAEVVSHQYAKSASMHLPLCHPVQIASIQLEVDSTNITIGKDYGTITVRACVKAYSIVGVEIEAIMAVLGYLVSLWDMNRALDVKAKISEVILKDSNN